MCVPLNAGPTARFGRKAFLFDTSLPGNSNVGHSGPYYGTDLSDADKWAVIEYMKTLH